MASEVAKPPYQRTAREQASVEAFIAKRDSRPPLPKVLVVWEAEAHVKIDIDHPDPGVGIAILLEALGISTFGQYDILLNQVIDLSSKNGRPDQDGINKTLAMVAGIGPKDATEAMLAVQMVAIHNATMTQAMRLKRSEMLHQMDSCSNSVNKLARTFAAQVDALKRYRTGGVQKVVVQHVQVNEGGQAIVAGEVTPGGGKSETEHQPYVRDEMRVPEGQAVLSHIETDPMPMSSAGSEGLECVPVPRSQRRPTLRAVE